MAKSIGTEDYDKVMSILKKYGYGPSVFKEKFLRIKSDPGEKVSRRSPSGKKMNMGGMMSPTKKKPEGSATGLTGMKGGGMMKKKGYAKGGMKKKGYAMGGAMKRPTANQKGLKKLPTTVRNKMGYMAKGGAARRGR
jgi:hypothetical protein